MLLGGITDIFALLEHYKLCLLSNHVDDDVAGDTLTGVFEPLEDIAVCKRSHADGRIFIVDLSKLGSNLKLRFLVY